MKGLMIKDLKTIMSNNRTLLMIVIAIVFIFSFMDNSAFVLGYITVLCSMLVIGTMSYDELDNGFAFLMTLPISRKSYVKEKYFFGFVYTLIVWLISCILLGIVSTIRGYGMDISYAVGVLVSCMILQAIMIPVQLRFGAEKSRIAFAVIVGAIFAIIGVSVLVMSKFGIFTEDIIEKGKNLSTVSDVLIAFILVVIAAVIVLASCKMSIKIMEKKEF